jgi:integrase
VASISTDKKTGNRRILFVDPNGKRKAVRLGKMPLAAVKAINVKVEHLLAAKVSGCPLDGETARWVADLSDELAEKLAAVGLIPKKARASLGEFVDAYIQTRGADAKPNTVANLRQAERYLVEFFGSSKRMNEIAPGDADDYRRWLATKVGENTARRHLGRARQFFRSAVRKRAVLENPFGDMKGIAVKENKSRDFFVTREMATAVLDACPDTEWKLLFALARFGGLRTPSEPLALKWTDVDWERSMIRVSSVKTEHHEGHAERLVPIFPELRPLLNEAWDAAQSGAEYVIARHRDENVNLRTHMHRIIRRAGLTPWPKTFQNLRSSRQTELVAEKYDIQDVCDWLGNSPAVALRHYLQRSDAGYKRAIGGAQAAHKQAQQETEPTETAEQTPVFPMVLLGDSSSFSEVPAERYPRQESNL